MLWRDTAYKGYGYDLKKKKKIEYHVMYIYCDMKSSTKKSVRHLFSQTLGLN